MLDECSREDHIPHLLHKSFHQSNFILQRNEGFQDCIQEDDKVFWSSWFGKWRGQRMLTNNTDSKYYVTRLYLIWGCSRAETFFLQLQGGGHSKHSCNNSGIWKLTLNSGQKRYVSGWKVSSQVVTTLYWPDCLSPYGTPG